MPKRRRREPLDYLSPPAKNLRVRRQAGMASCKDDVPAVIKEVQENLREKYKKATLLVGFSADQEHPLEDVFVNLVMLPGSKLSTEFREIAGYGSSADLDRIEHIYSRAAQQHTVEKIDLPNLFNIRMPGGLGDRVSVRVVVLASGGCGKTVVFLKHAPREWALGRIWQDRFVLVVAREFSSPDVKKAVDAVALLGLKKYAVTDESKAFLNNYILRNSSKICLILDGLDETSLDSCTGYVGDVVRGKELVGISLIVTSRPANEIFKLCAAKPFNRHVEVIGFQGDQVSQYVSNVMKNSEKKNDLLGEIEADPKLEAMMSTPFYAAAICELFKEGYPLPTCSTDVFDSMVLRAVSRMKAQFITDWNKVERADQELIYEVGSFAMHMLFHRNIVFSKDDMDTYKVSKTAMSLGLLVQYEVTAEDPTPLFRFSHLALQESLASQFVAACDGLSPDVLGWMVRKLGGLTGHLNTFWPLLTAKVSNAHADALLSSLLLSAVDETMREEAREAARRGVPLEELAAMAGGTAEGSTNDD